MTLIIGTSGNDVLIGGAGDDEINGNAGADVVYGGAGRDFIRGGTENDEMFGGDDDDILLGEDGDDTIEGNAGADVIYGGLGRDFIRGGSDYDQLFGDDGADILLGEDGDDTIEGNAGADVIYGGLGRDFIRGGTENDEVFGGDGADTLLGEDGDDTIEGNAGTDVIYGGAGRDFIRGGTENDEIFGGGGDDILLGEDGDDTIEGNAGTDVIYGGAGRDFIRGGADYDQIFGGDGADILLGEDGDDTIEGNVGADVIYGGAGRDFIRGGTEGDEIFGDAGADVLVGDAGDDFMRGGTENDEIFGGDGADILLGEDGDDTIEGNAGADVIYGGLGRDFIRGGTENDEIFGDGGDDILLGEDGDDEINGNAGADVIYGGAGRDFIRGGTENDEIFGGDGADTLLGEDGDDTIEGNAGTDVIYGGAGRDFIRGGSDYDQIFGGDGADTLLGEDGDDTIEGNAGADVIYGGLGRDFIRGGADYDQIFGDDGDDILLGEDGDDTVEGNAGADVIYGGAGRDFIRGGSNYDQLFGDDGDDILLGEDGDDQLVGGNGRDVLAGGLGRDSFHFGTALVAANIDEIVDFEVGIDRITLAGASGEPFSALAEGGLAAHAFVANAGGVAMTSAQMVIYNTTTGALLYDADGSGAGAAVQFATLQASLSLSAADFFIGGGTNSAPFITSGAAATIAENSPTSTIVYQATATDANGDRITYALTGADASHFSIDSTGAVRFLQSPDFEVRSAYSIVIEARDSAVVATRGVTINVTDVNEGPPSSGSTPIIAETAGANDSIGAAQAILRTQLAVAPNPNLQDQSLPSVQINGAITPLGDSDYFSVTLKAGELLILDVDGTNALDAFLRVFGPSGMLIAENDDSVSFDPGSSAHSGISHNLDSLVRFRASVDGIYTFQIRSFESGGTPTSSGSYTINLSIGPSVPQSVIDLENVDALVSGSRWNTSNVTYGFTTSPTQYSGTEGSPERDTNYETLNATQRSVTATAFGLISQYTPLSFSENVASPGSGQIRLAQSDTPETAYAFYPGPGEGGDVWFRNSAPADAPAGALPRYDNPVVGNYGYLTFLHEIGHALGLKHGHESPALSPDRDSMEYSIMTYRGFIGADTETGYRNETWGFAQTLMMYDIAAIQKIYGANFTTQAGDTTYSWSPTTGAFSIDGAVQWTPGNGVSGSNRVFQTVWDGGGTDTYNMSAYGNGVTIDLRPGEWSTTSQVQLANLGGSGNPLYARGNVANALLFNGDARSLIENAVGGAGNDTLIANQAQNRLTGGSGADTFAWRSTGDAQTPNPDRILDFVQGVDKIDLSGIDAISGTTANDAFTFIGTNAFTGVAGQLRYAVDANGVNVYGDVDGNGIADLHIIVNGTSIAGTDFIF